MGQRSRRTSGFGQRQPGLLMALAGARTVSSLVLLVLPWLHAYTAGPVANAWPWMIAAACTGLWILLGCLAMLGQQPAPSLLPLAPSHTVAGAWLTAASASAVIGLMQYFDTASAWSGWISQTENAGEAFANLRQRNHFATLTSIGLAALLGWVGLQQQRIRNSWPLMAAAGALALLLALGNAASNSRTGSLQWPLLVALAWLWVWVSSRNTLLNRDTAAVLGRAYLATAALLAYAAAVVLLPVLLGWATGVDTAGLWGRMGEQAGCSSRWILWGNVLELIALKPWLGWGWGNLDYAHFTHLYNGPRFCEILDNAHNLPLHLAVELGIPAAALLCGGALWAVLVCKPWLDTDPARQMAWSVLAVIGLHSLLEYPLWYGPFQLAAALAALILWQTRRGRPLQAFKTPISAKNAYFSVSKVPLAQQNRARAAIIFIALTTACIMALAALGYAAWDYRRISAIYLPPEQRSAALRDDTLEKIQNSWLYADTVAFAELSTTPLTPANAAHLNALAISLLPYSPEAKVVEKIIESAVMLGRNDEALYYLQRFKAAYPEAYAQWSDGLKPR